MSKHRKRHRRRTKHLANRRRKRILFFGVSVLMLIAIMLLIVPRARQQHLSTSMSFGLAFLLWLCAVFAVRTCLRARRKYRKPGDERHTPHTDFSDSDDDDDALPVESSSGKAARN